MKSQLTNVKKERKMLFRFLKILDKKLHIKVRKVGYDEQPDLLKYLVISKMKEKHLELERIMIENKRNIKRGHSGIDYLEHQISKLPSKIKLFEIDFDKEEFKKICSLLKKLEKEVENV